MKRHVARTSRELRVLASPERQAIVQTLVGRRSMSVREIGEAVGRLPVSLYYHLRALERVGLIVRAGRREAERGDEALYKLPADEITIRPSARGRAEVDAMRKIGAGAFRRAQRLHDAMVREAPARQASKREHLLAQRTVRLDVEGLERVNALLGELIDLLENAPSAEEGAYYTVTLHLARNPVRR